MGRAFHSHVNVKSATIHNLESGPTERSRERGRERGRERSREREVERERGRERSREVERERSKELGLAWLAGQLG